MDVSSLPMKVFYEYYGSNVSSHIFENFVTPLDRTRGLLIAAYSMLFLIGTCGNGYIMMVITFVLYRSPNSDAPRSMQIFILALCSCDLLVLSFLTMLIADLAYGRWMIESSWVCLLYLSSESLNKFCSPFLLMALSCLCYLSICQSSNRRFSSLASSASSLTRSNSDLRIPLLIVGVCFLLMLVLVTPVYIYGDVHYVVFENGSELWAAMPKCAFQPPEHVLRIFTAYTFLFGYIIPAALFTYFYSAVLLFVRRHARQCSSVSSLHFWRVAKTTMGLVVFYLLCWTPYWALNIFEFFRPLSTSADESVPSDATVILGYMIHMLPYVNCCGYPLIYTLLNRNITQAYDNAKRNRNGYTRRRLLTGPSTNNHSAANNSRACTQQHSRASISGVKNQLTITTPSPTRSCVSYLAVDGGNPLATGRKLENGNFPIHTSLTTEMTGLSPSSAMIVINRRSVSASNINDYGSMV